MSESRFASLKQRRALWRSSNGLCRMCGVALQHDFHADHNVTPWAVGRDTNTHDLQALCASCNAKKGKHMFRLHQRKALEIANAPSIGVKVKKVLAAVTPGGGKSAIPVIFAERMIARGLADKICWVVPRDSLRRQAERSFLDAKFRGLLGHKREIRAAGNDINPTRGLDGYSTTYQAIACDPDLHADEFRRHRYVLVLDEDHHVEHGGIWHKALQAMVDRAALVVILSGTLSRADGSRIAFIEYGQDEGGKAQAILHDTETMRVIRYTRRNALEEKAVLPIYFERIDGRARWIDNRGEEREVSSLAGIGDDASSALYTALRQEYAYDLLREMVDHWRAYAAVNPRSKFLVVAPNISLAKTYLKRARDLGIVDVDIATSEDSDDAKLNIDRLKGHKKPVLQGLVTVGMAYEGLDCPEITHIACLTHIRSHEWIEQMLARATRVDYAAGDYYEQGAYVWAPDDDLFSDAVAAIQAEQAPFIRESADDKEDDGTPGDSAPREFDLITPLDAASTAIRASDMQTGEVIDGSEYKAIKDALREVGAAHVSVAQFKHAMELVEKRGSQQEAAATVADVALTASEKETAIRKQLDRRIKQICRGNPDTIKDMNISLVRRFRKGREELNKDELQAALLWVEEFAARVTSALEARNAGA